MCHCCASLSILILDINWLCLEALVQTFCSANTSVRAQQGIVGNSVDAGKAVKRNRSSFGGVRRDNGYLFLSFYIACPRISAWCYSVLLRASVSLA